MVIHRTFDALKAEFPRYLTEEDRGNSIAELLYLVASRQRDDMADKPANNPAVVSHCYHVVGNAIYASGFDVVVQAVSPAAAHEMVEVLVSTDQLGACMSQMDLQEVCINECYLTEETVTELDN